MAQPIYTASYKSPVGELLLGVHNNQLCLCDWQYRKQRKTINQRICSGLQAEMQQGQHQIIDETIAQLEDYFNGKRKQFELPLLFVGTDFQQQIWQALQTIPFGQTTTYLQLSKQLGQANLVRAVANANGANAISIIVPCHRVIGANGDLVGYAGGLRAKKRLLQLESGSQQQELF